jgi:translation initiation factor IF-3
LLLDPATEIRLVMADGTHAIISAADALSAASAAKLDLVPVAAAATPPVYRLGSANAAAAAAREREGAARARVAAARRAAGFKEIRVTALAAQHDVDTRLRRARELVEKGHTVKLAVPVGGGGVPRAAALARLLALGAAASPWCEVRDPPAHASRGSGPASVSKYLWPLGSASGEGAGAGAGAGAARKKKAGEV